MNEEYYFVEHGLCHSPLYRHWAGMVASCSLFYFLNVFIKGALKSLLGLLPGLLDARRATSGASLRVGWFDLGVGD